MENRNDDILLINLVKMLEMTARAGLGQIENPVNDNKKEINLEQARVNIDLLEMLKRKTAPSNPDDINKYIKELVSNLQMKYLDISSKGEKGSEGEEKKEGASGREE